ncbi:MAG: hypothetical protein HY709_07570 [Candidatus Latescibacteria bacterium]|nr:hypothetical protein [Candidatus Latescibacterota bacterium]
MDETITLDIPADLARRVREIAVHTNRRFEEVLVEWLDRAIDEPPVEVLSDEQILALCDRYMDADQQEELGALLVQHREGQLNDVERVRLDDLMQVYRHGLVRKAQALNIAVKRGLRPPLG